MREDQLIELAKEGDLDAYDDLMKGYYPVVEKFSYQLGHSLDRADDLTQEVFLLVYRHLHQYTRGKFSTWLYKITLNVVRDDYRRRQRQKAKEDQMKQQNAPATDSAETSMLHHEQDRRLHALIQTLDEKYKLPVILFYFQDREQAEIADILDVPVNTVKTRLSRGKAQLKHLLEKE